MRAIGTSSHCDWIPALTASDPWQDAGELFQAMELEMEARAPSNAAFLAPPPGRVAAFGTWALSFIIPGLGMFTEAYFVFSVRASAAV